MSKPKKELNQYRVEVKTSSILKYKRKPIVLSYETYEEALQAYIRHSKAMGDHMSMVSGKASVKLLDVKKPIKQLLLTSTKFDLL